MITKTQIDAQCREYATARALIDVLPDALERQIGLAALRLEATATYQQLATTGASASSGALSPLRDYVSALSGGERVEKIVGTVDQNAQKQAIAIVSAATTGALTGVWALPAAFGALFSFLSLFTNVLVSLGQNLAGAFLAGAIPVILVVRALQYGPKVANSAVSAAQGSWRWAKELGSRSDHALTQARNLQADLWRAAGGSAARTGSEFTSKARDRATVAVGFLIGVTILGLICFVVGVGRGLGLA